MLLLSKIVIFFFCVGHYCGRLRFFTKSRLAVEHTCFDSPHCYVLIHVAEYYCVNTAVVRAVVNVIS